MPSRSGPFQTTGLQWLGLGGILGTQPLPTPKGGSGASTRMALGAGTISAPRRKKAVNYCDTNRPSSQRRDRPRHDQSLMVVLSEWMVTARSESTVRFIMCALLVADLDQAAPPSAITSTSDATRASLAR